MIIMISMILCQGLPLFLIIPNHLTHSINLECVKPCFFFSICCHSNLYSICSNKNSFCQREIIHHSKDKAQIWVCCFLSIVFFSPSCIQSVFTSVHTIWYVLLPVNHLIPTGGNGSVCKHMDLSHFIFSFLGHT